MAVYGPTGFGRSNSKSNPGQFVADSPLEGTGFEPSVPAKGPAFFETAAEPGDDEPAGSQSRILTIDKGGFTETVGIARLPFVMF